MFVVGQSFSVSNCGRRTLSYARMTTSGHRKASGRGWMFEPGTGVITFVIVIPLSLV